MKGTDMVECLSNAIIDYHDRTEETNDATWVKHPTFDGVFLKHLIKGQDADNSLSCHMVRVEPGKVMEEHIHDPQWELHEVIEGTGTCRLGTKEIPYAPGRMALIPQGVKHSVRAGERGLVLLAKFFPPLL